jgi:hypothetical protein
MLRLTATIATIIAGWGVAHAGGLVCNVQDTVGSRMVYAFGPNTTNANGSFGGTMVETGFEKNGRMVVSEVGVRPVWIYSGNMSGGFDLYSRAAPGWMLRRQRQRHATAQRPLRGRRELRVRLANRREPCQRSG